MYKKVKIAVVSSAVLVMVTAVSTFAQKNISENAVIKSVVRQIDTQFSLIPIKNLDQASVPAISAPSPVRAGQQDVTLVDVTQSLTVNGEVVSSYPDIYKMFSSEENWAIIKVFSLAKFKSCDQRIEVYYTGGDWMQYGLTYIITNAGRDVNKVRAYFVGELSTPDREDGVVPPKVDPFDTNKLKEFIIKNFLDLDGNVRSGFQEVASMPVSD